MNTWYERNERVIETIGSGDGRQRRVATIVDILWDGSVITDSGNLYDKLGMAGDGGRYRSICKMKNHNLAPSGCGEQEASDD